MPLPSTNTPEVDIFTTRGTSYWELDDLVEGDIILRYEDWTWSRRKGQRNKIGKILSFEDTAKTRAKVRWDNGKVSTIKTSGLHYALAYEVALDNLLRGLHQRLERVKAFKDL
jgi:hypothetical protein